MSCKFLARVSAVVLGLALTLSFTKISFATPAPPSPLCEVQATVVNVKNTPDLVFTLKVTSLLNQTGDATFYNCQTVYPLGSVIDVVMATGENLPQNIAANQILKATLHFAGDEFSNGVSMSNVSIIEDNTQPPNETKPSYRLYAAVAVAVLGLGVVMILRKKFLR